MRRVLAMALVVTGVLAGTGAAAAERVVVSLSNHHVMITSSYTGEDLVLFGSIERDAASPPVHGSYDIVATITGPRESLRARRKERVLGIWVNTSAQTFADAPSYLAVLASRPFDAMVSAADRQRLQLGLADMPLGELGDGGVAELKSDPFRAALLRLMQERGLYREEPNGVTFLTPMLFRAAVPLPAQVPTGNYEVDVKLFAGGKAIAHTNSAFEIVKIGFEQFVVDAARDHGLLYGLATALMALLAGALASIAFRRG